MTDIIQKRKPGFQKGEVSNPKGKPVGTHSEYRKQFIEIQKLAAGKVSKVFELLEKAIEAGESWAHQIYWKELYRLPKRYFEETINLPRVDPKDTNNINARLKLLIEAMERFDDYTFEDVLSAIKALANIKSNQVMENQAEHVRLTREELGQKIENFVEAMKYMKKEEGDKVDE